MSIFSHKKSIENRADQVLQYDEQFAKALSGEVEEKIDKDRALEVPTVNACISLIGDVIASLPIRLYKQESEKTIEIKDDHRVYLLNVDSGDTLTPYQMKKAWVEDMYLGKGGYSYIERDACFEIRSLRYVSEEYICINNIENPIFKDYVIYVWGEQYMPYDFLKILRKTKDGCTSKSIIDENSLSIGVAYNELRCEKNLVSEGGNKKGFLKSKNKLSDNAISSLKSAFKKLYSNNKSSVVVLNDGIEFQESSNSSVEMQLNENKITNASENAKLFEMSVKIIDGSATPEDTKNFVKYAVMPIVNTIESSLSRDLLKESEKGSFYFAFDTKELNRGSLKERYEAYAIGLKNNFLQVDEVRNMEDMEALGIEWITLGLDQVLYNPHTHEVYTPNTDKTTIIKKRSDESNEN